MKINIPKPCKQKLSTTNFCSQCQHVIPDLSLCSSSELEMLFDKENIQCAIFSSNQVNTTLKLNSIINVVVVSSIGLISTQSLAQLPKEELNKISDFEQSINTRKISFTLQLNEKDKDILATKETFRLLLNDELVLDTLELNQDYKIEFEIDSQEEIILRVASNQSSIDIERMYFQYNFPKEINIKRSDLSVRQIIMGKIAYPSHKKMKNKDTK